MQLQLSNIHGPIGVTASYTKCMVLGFLFGCDKTATIASVSIPGIVAQ
jgi:hypothetical protein